MPELCGRAAKLLMDLNTLLLRATCAELRLIMPSLAATHTQVSALLLEKGCHNLASTNGKCGENGNGHYLTAAEAAKMTGYSRSFLYEHGERLRIATRPEGARGLRFPEEWVRAWMESHQR